MHLPGQIVYFHSKIDARLCPYAICSTDSTDAPKALIVETTPGALDDLPRAIKQAEEIAEMASNNGHSCVVIRPTGRGRGSVYQNYGEIDLLEAIEHVCLLHPIDRDRISVTGVSMGGAAVWYLISHYPDIFSAAAPIDGYCDYRLWKKPGGYTFPVNDWEVPSWEGRSAAFLASNLRNTPVWIVHGEWDRAIGGGVSVEHSRQMSRLMTAQGIIHKYTEVPRAGHAVRRPELLADVVGWLLEQHKTRAPTLNAFKTYGLRHHSSHGAQILQLQRYDKPGQVDVQVGKDHSVHIETSGVRTLALNAVANATSACVTIDGSDLGRFDLSHTPIFQRNHGKIWTTIDGDLSREKRPMSSGPIGDLFFHRVVLVHGTVGTEEETHFNQWVASNAQLHYNLRNGGVHRGGILGVNEVQFTVEADCDCHSSLLEENNLILFGTDKSNSVIAEYKNSIPVQFDRGRIQICNKEFLGSRAAVFAVFPHPKNPHRYVAVHGGTTPDAISWGSHLDMHLLPDYFVYCESDVLGWGFFDNKWQLP